MINLEGQVAIITGGAQGIGEGVCKVFCDAGATVALWDVRDSGAETAAKLKDEGGKIFFQKVDITNREAVDAAVNEIIGTHSKIDVLINNAGIVRDKSILKMTQEEWDAVINVNLNSLFITTQAVLPHMREARYGRIISASSINGFAGAFGQTNYSASKAGVSLVSLARFAAKWDDTALRPMRLRPVLLKQK